MTPRTLGPELAEALDRIETGTATGQDAQAVRVTLKVLVCEYKSLARRYEDALRLIDRMIPPCLQ